MRKQFGHGQPQHRLKAITAGYLPRIESTAPIPVGAEPAARGDRRDLGAVPADLARSYGVNQATISRLAAVSDVTPPRGTEAKASGAVRDGVNHRAGGGRGHRVSGRERRISSGCRSTALTPWLGMMGNPNLR